MTDEDLRRAFSAYIIILITKVIRDDERSKGFGFVSFGQPEETSKAMTDMNGNFLHSRRL